MSETQQPTVPAGAALYMALVQFLFVTTWTIYVIFLPKLLESAGLPASYTPWILLLDQLTFMATDIYAGVKADHAQRMLGRIGPMIVGWTVLSCVAFLLLPHVALLGGVAPAAALALILIWTTTSSALRAPPWTLLGKYAAKPSLPRMNMLMLIGLAVGGAISPYLGIVLKNVDPRLPFALSSLTLLAATAGIIYVERALQRQPAVPVPKVIPQVLTNEHWMYMAGILLLAGGFQIHFSLNSAAQFLRFAKPADLEWLMPLFWVGFGVAMMPGSSLCNRFGSLPVMAVSALLGAAGAFAAANAGSLDMLIAAQVVAGCAWGNMLMAAFCSAADLGRSGREGLALGMMFAMLAFAALGRIGAAIAGVNKNPDYAMVLALIPVIFWMVGGIIIWVLAIRIRPATA
jgi:MFS family permease